MLSKRHSGEPQPTLNTYSASWWVRGYPGQRYQNPPFKFWVTAERNHEHSGHLELEIYAVIEALSSKAVEETVAWYFPDADIRFVKPYNAGYQPPADRSPSGSNSADMQPSIHHLLPKGDVRT